MYKTKLQELCQRRSWSLPEYQTTREGPNHNPRFSSTVIVNDTPFRSSSPTRNAKLAQNNAAMLAFHHFSEPNPIPNPIPNPVPVPVPDPDPVPSIPNLSSFPQPSLCAHSTSSSPGSPCPSPDVDKILPTNTVLPPTGEATCQTPQISSPVTTDKDITKAQDQKNVLHLYKNQLQSYAQKRNLNLPVYSSEWEGPPHSLRFKCKVTIDGQSYESPKFYSTLKDAEHAAAEVALMSLAPSGVQEDDTGLYKNLLQELVQKEGFHLPIYSTTKSGEAHMPVFMSQVEVDGEHFTGQEAKSKKQAEMSAAKVAYTALKERKARQGQAPEFSPNCSEANVVNGLRHHSNPKLLVSPGLVIRNQPNKDKAHQGQAAANLRHDANPKALVSVGPVACNKLDKDRHPAVTAKEGSSSCATSTIGSSQDSSLTKDWSAPTLSDSTSVASETGNMSSTAITTPSRRKKVAVYSRKTNVKIEDGGTVMPISDDKWVAYSYSH